MKQFSRKLVSSKQFELFIIFVILVNSVLIGVETYTKTSLIVNIQQLALYIFTFEIIARWIARDSVKGFFTDGWNVFDLSIVLVSYVPETLFANASMIAGLRVLRVFRVLRLLRTATEIKLIIAVLVRSFSALTYNAIFFFIFMYLFSIIGVSLFKIPDAESATPEIALQIEAYKILAPNAPETAPDPYSNLGETMFTLFRILTGEDWTDIRYNLIVASKMGLIHVSETVVTTYHVLWFVLAAFLMLNLLVGAILNNYQVIMEQQKQEKNAKTS